MWLLYEERKPFPENPGFSVTLLLLSGISPGLKVNCLWLLGYSLRILSVPFMYFFKDGLIRPSN